MFSNRTISSLFLKTRYDPGTISGIDPTGLWITVHSIDENESECIGCKKCGPTRPASTLFVKATRPQLYSLHQKVIVKRTLPAPGWAEGFVFGVPLGFAFTLLLVWNFISSQTVGSPLSIAATVAAILFGFVAVLSGDAFIRNKFPAGLSIAAGSDTIRHAHG